MSRIVKIATASATIIALLGLGGTALAEGAVVSGPAGCCVSAH